MWGNIFILHIDTIFSKLFSLVSFSLSDTAKNSLKNWTVLADLQYCTYFVSESEWIFCTSKNIYNGCFLEMQLLWRRWFRSSFRLLWPFFLPLFSLLVNYCDYDSTNRFFMVFIYSISVLLRPIKRKLLKTIFTMFTDSNTLFERIILHSNYENAFICYCLYISFLLSMLFLLYVILKYQPTWSKQWKRIT